MRFVTYAGSDGDERPGVIAGDRVHPLPGVPTVLELVRGGLPAALVVGERALGGDFVALADVRLRAPLAPPTLRDFVSFEEHVEGVRQAVEQSRGVPDAWYDAPTFYFTNPYAVVGPDDGVAAPTGCARLDFELEVAVVVGAGGASLSVEQARDAVFGYTLLNDWSARDVQGREMQVGLGPAKGKDFASSLGPWLVTADELEPYRDAEGFLDLDCRVAVNGVQVGRDVLSNMGWTFETMIAYASRDTVVRPGDVLGSGTVGNGGCLAELWGRRGALDPPPLAPGDVVELTVQGLGTLRNPVVAGSPRPPLPAVRRRDSAAARAALLPQLP